MVPPARFLWLGNGCVAVAHALRRCVQIGDGRHGQVYEFVDPACRQQPTGLVIKVAPRVDYMCQFAFDAEERAYERCQQLCFTGLPRGASVFPYRERNSEYSGLVSAQLCVWCSPLFAVLLCVSVV